MASSAAGLAVLWSRKLPHYPTNPARAKYLAVIVLIAVCQYYELYVFGSVGPLLAADLHMSFQFLIYVGVVGSTAGAFASIAAGLADRWGRANLVAYGSLMTALLTLLWLPHAGSKGVFMAGFAVLSAVEGIILVATPALIRDFSPQLGRGSAMAFWSLGPALGSIVVNTIATNTLATHSNWRDQFYWAGITGIVVSVLGIILLRELAPGLRDQLMVSLRDRTLIEAKAAKIDPEALLEHHWKQMLRADIIGGAIGVSLLLVIYYTVLAAGVVYFTTTFQYAPERANGLLNWWWIPLVVALIGAGVLSDLVKVRKPFMLLGGTMMVLGAVLLATHSTQPGTSYYTFAAILLLLGAGQGLAFAPWMASFTETVEKHNPAATATGLAVWGWILRATAAAFLIFLAAVVSSATPLVDNGPRVAAIAAKYPAQLQTLATVDPATLATLATDPTNAAALQSAVGAISTQLGVTPQEAISRLTAASQVPKADLLYVQEHGPKVQQALVDAPKQWRTWYWIGAVAALLFLPLIFIMAGYWNPAKARAAIAEHERQVEIELRQLTAERADVGGLA
jgi:MFS family permease